MPVVINEFEVLDTPPEQAQRQEPQAGAAAPPLPEPEDLRRLLALQAERELRLAAH